MIKVVIFDADGVLINSEMVSSILKREYGIDSSLTAEFFDGVFMECIVGKKDLRVEIEPYLTKLGWIGSVDDFLHFWHTTEHSVNEELVDYIQNLRLKGLICCLATNQAKYRFSYMLKKMGFQDAFDKVYASGHIGYRKPFPEFYRHITTDLGIRNLQEILFWDDSQENVEGAKKFGIQAELYTSFEDFKEKMKVYLKA